MRHEDCHAGERCGPFCVEVIPKAEAVVTVKGKQRDTVLEALTNKA